MPEMGTGSQIALLLREINLMLKENIRNTFKNCGLTFPQMMAIRILSKRKRLKVTELSSEMNLAASTVSGIVDRLEKMDLVKRVRSEEDKRIVYVEISDRAEEIHEDVHNLMNNYLENILRDASREEINAILAGLETLKGLLIK